MQSEVLKEKLQERKLQIFKRKQRRTINKTLNISGGQLDSPNMSRSKCLLTFQLTKIIVSGPNDATQQSRIEDDSVMLAVGEVAQSLLVDDGHSILKNMDSELNNEEMPSGDEEEAEDDPEMLAELETRQEDLIEEFMGKTFDLKQEKVEEVKATCKAEGLSRELTK